MVLKEILELDCRKEENKNILLNKLNKIKPLSKYDADEIPLEDIEKVIKKIQNELGVKLVMVVPDLESNKNKIIWKVDVSVGKRFKQYETIYGCTLYEAMSKTAIFFYDKLIKVRKGK